MREKGLNDVGIEIEALYITTTRARISLGKGDGPETETFVVILQVANPAWKSLVSSQKRVLHTHR